MLVKIEEFSLILLVYLLLRLHADAAELNGFLRIENFNHVLYYGMKPVIQNHTSRARLRVLLSDPGS